MLWSCDHLDGSEIYVRFLYIFGFDFVVYLCVKIFIVVNSATVTVFLALNTEWRDETKPQVDRIARSFELCSTIFTKGSETLDTRFSWVFRRGNRELEVELLTGIHTQPTTEFKVKLCMQSPHQRWWSKRSVCPRLDALERGITRIKWIAVTRLPRISSLRGWRL